MQKAATDEIERYLRTGAHDPHFAAWPGEHFLACARRGDVALRGALISTVRSRTPRVSVPAALGVDLIAFTRARLAPMVRGLFRPGEHEVVLGVLGQSVVFLTPDNIETVIGEARWLHTAWDLANLYLASVGAERLAEDAPQIVGLSEETSCYVSMDYFRMEGHFDDFIVHEAAHIFHNCQRSTIGLRPIRGREWLLEVAFGKRETFAYACEAYSRILESGDSPPKRRLLLAKLEQGAMPPDERVDAGEYIDILREAVADRNGWKRILERCSPSRPARRRGFGAA